MNIVFMGTPNFSATIFEELIKHYDVSLVVTKPDMVVGRKKELKYSPLKEAALKHGVKVFQPEAIKNEFVPVLEMKPDLIITAAFGQFIPEEIIKYPKYGCINVHGSLLPKYRGGSPIQSAIINGEKETGISIMYMEKKMDSGDIIYQKAIPILDSDNNETMFNKLADLGASMLIETIPLLIEGKAPRIKQNENEVTFAYNIKHEEQFIDWNQPSRTIFNKIRGLANEPGALTTFNDLIFKIFKSEIVSYEGFEEAGTILNLSKKMLVKTKDGALSILELQQSGKNKMDIKSYLNGQKMLNVGDKLK